MVSAHLNVYTGNESGALAIALDPSFATNHFVFVYYSPSATSVDRLSRFVGRQDVDAATFCEIARLMAIRMSYEDPIRIAQLKLAELEGGAGAAHAPSTDVKKFRLDELIGSLPANVAEPVLPSQLPPPA